MIAFRISKQSIEPIFVCDKCSQVISHPADGNLLSIDSRSHELLVGWLVHKKCDRDMRAKMPFQAATADLSDVAGRAFPIRIIKSQRPFNDSTMNMLDEVYEKLSRSLDEY